jgi:hypothetical protein
MDIKPYAREQKSIHITERIADGILHKAPADSEGHRVQCKTLAAWSDITPIARNE